MASGPTTTTTYSEFIPELWSAKSIDSYETNLVIAKRFGNWNPLFAGGGDTAHIPIFKNLTADDVQDIPETKQALFDPQVSDAASVDLIIDRKKYASVEIADPLQVFANQDLVSKFTNKLGYALARYVDEDLAGIYAATANTAVSLASMSTLTEAVILQRLSTALRYFEDHDVPANGRAWIFNPLAHSYLRVLEKFASIDFGTDQSIATGVVGSILGIPVYVSNCLKQTGSSSTPTTHCMLVQEDALAWADPKPIETKFAPGDGRYVHAQVTATVYYGWVSAPNDGTSNYGIVDIQVS